MQTIKNLPYLDIHADDRVFRGGAQTWYDAFWRRRAGCGPTCASNLAWYLARSRERLRPLWSVVDASRAEYISLMNEMFEYVTPGMRGVNTTEIFTAGVTRFAADRGLKIGCRVLEVPEAVRERPDPGALSDFMRCAIEDDLPVAFLNLSNGQLLNLDSWHWVTLVGFEPVSMRSAMLDMGNGWDIDIGLWLKTTRLGGGFVVVYPA